MSNKQGSLEELEDVSAGEWEVLVIIVETMAFGDSSCICMPEQIEGTHLPTFQERILSPSTLQAY